jgi:hypothetical protein
MEPAASATGFAWLYWTAAALAALVLIAAFWVARKGARIPGEHVFRASRFSTGNRLLPAQVMISRDSITLYQPQWIGKIENSIHIAHVSSIKIDTNLLFSDVLIETTGGHHPIVCHGHTKGDALKIKKLIETLQSERYQKGDTTKSQTGSDQIPIA